MAHSALHFSLGMAVGYAAVLPAVVRGWRSGRPLHRTLGRGLIVSCALGIYATLPSLLGWAGVPEAVCRGWWMNLFFLHPLVTRVKAGGMIPAGFALVVCWLLPYAVLLAAIRRAQRRSTTQDAGAV